MGHVPSLCVLCNSCYLKWCDCQILAIAPLQSMYGKELTKTLSNILHSSWERGHVNLIFLPNPGLDVRKVMGHAPSLRMLCNSCYSRNILSYVHIHSGFIALNRRLCSVAVTPPSCLIYDVP